MGMRKPTAEEVIQANREVYERMDFDGYTENPPDDYAIQSPQL